MSRLLKVHFRARIARSGVVCGGHDAALGDALGLHYSLEVAAGARKNGNIAVSVHVAKNGKKTIGMFSQYGNNLLFFFVHLHVLFPPLCVDGDRPTNLSVALCEKRALKQDLEVKNSIFFLGGKSFTSAPITGCNARSSLVKRIVFNSAIWQPWRSNCLVFSARARISSSSGSFILIGKEAHLDIENILMKKKLFHNRSPFLRKN
jgi:hypothetical protein